MKLDTNRKTIELYQNFANLGLCVIVASNILYYSWYNKNLDFSVPVIFTYFVCDLFICKPEIKIHHMLGIAVLAFKMYYRDTIVDDSNVVLALYKTELSTFFYIFKCLMDTYNIKSTILTTMNNSLFFATFFKYRIYDYFFDVIINPITYSVLDTYSGGSRESVFFACGGIYGLYILNIYWFSIMCKILYKPINQYFSVSTFITVSHKILSYSYCVNIPIAYIIYSSNPNVAYLFDMIGIVSLSYGSYYYHQKIVNYYKKHGDIEYTSYSLMKPFVFDKATIHLRSFLCLTTFVYETDYWFILIISAGIHINCLFSLVQYFYYLKKQNEVVVYDLKSDNCIGFLQLTNLLVGGPILMDVLFVALNTNYWINGIELFFITILCFIVLKINSFYEMNHVFVHGLLMLQTFCLCLCNIHV